MSTQPQVALQINDFVKVTADCGTTPGVARVTGFNKLKDVLITYVKDGTTDCYHRAFLYVDVECVRASAAWLWNVCVHQQRG